MKRTPNFIFSVLLSASFAAILLFFIYRYFSAPIFQSKFLLIFAFIILNICVDIKILKSNSSNIFLPSSIVLILFLVIPPMGIWGYKIFIRLYGCYMGGKVVFDFPLTLWYFGSLIFSVSMLIGKKLFNYPKLSFNQFIGIDLSRLKVSFYIFLTISIIFSSIALLKVGYVPILKGNIDVIRFSYINVIGDNIIKFSRLWLVVAIISTHLFFLEKRRLFYIFVIICAGLNLVIFGQRIYLLIPIVYFFLISTKFGLRVSFKKIIVFFVLIVSLYYSISVVRSFERIEFRKLAFIERIVYRTFGEWREYSYSVNKFCQRPNSFLGGSVFYGVMAAVIPKEVFRIYGFDKNSFLPYNAANFFGRYFDHYAGVRIGVVGESYVAFGSFGVIGLMILLGLFFSYLEQKFISLDWNDARISIVAFILSLSVFLPLLTFINFTTIITFFGFFICLVSFFCRSTRFSGKFKL